MFDDLRDFIKAVDELGDCITIENADWDVEMGVLTELQSSLPDSPLLLFDKIKGYKAGYRVCSNLFTTPRRTAIGLGLPMESRGIELVKALRERLKEGIKTIPPVQVTAGPILDNVHTGNDVDLFEFPAPKWHELDGGRYLGTGAMTITRDPDEGWVNLSVQRVQVQDKNTATILMGNATHSNIMRKKYWAKGLSCPVAVACGQEPMLWAAAGWPVPWGFSEYDFAGGLRNKPVEVIKGVATGLPIPASAEIVLEGELVSPKVETRIEGPFGEWTGYYAGGAGPEPAFRIKAILHRNDPIIQGNPPAINPAVWTLGRHIVKAAVLWNELDRQIPGVHGTWMVEEAGYHSIAVISVKQEYAGHAKQAASIALGCNATANGLRYVLVVDEDIDPSDKAQVLWALGTRADPENAIDIIKGTRTETIDPSLSPEKKERGELIRSVGVILACKPYHWIKDFAPSIRTSPELVKKVRDKWSHLFP